MISHGYNYYGEMDVNKWTHTRNNGTNWVWDNIQELYDETPFYCDPLDTVLCSAEYMNEEDMYGVGPENPASAYDPTDTRRQMFWLTTNHNINHADTATVRWSASMLVPAHRIITVLDSNGKEFMFQGVHTGYVSNGTYSITGTINGNTLTVTNTSGTITPGSTYIFGGTISDEVVISSQVSGTTGGTGVYTITSKLNPNGFNIPKTVTFQVSAVSSARFSVTGTTEPKWTFNTGDTFVDGTTTWKCIGPWQYDLGSIIRVGGGNDPSSGYVERIGTLMSEERDYIYNAIFDMSKAAFDPSLPYNVFARLQKNMWVDFSAEGTQSAQNNHLLGYVPGYNDASGSHTGEFTYKVSASASAFRKAFTGLSVGDDAVVNIYQKLNSLNGLIEAVSNTQFDAGVTVSGEFQAKGVSTFSSQIVLASKTKDQILAIASPAEGMMVFNSDDHVTETYRCPPSGTCGWYAQQYEASPLSK